MQWTYEIHNNHLERGGRVSEEGGVCSLRKLLFQSLQQGFSTFFYPESRGDGPVWMLLIKKKKSSQEV